MSLTLPTLHKETPLEASDFPQSPSEDLEPLLCQSVQIIDLRIRYWLREQSMNELQHSGPLDKYPPSLAPQFLLFVMGVLQRDSQL